MGYIPAASRPSALGWAGQEPVRLGPAGAVITPGVGLVARTIDGGLFLDSTDQAAADKVSFCAPGLVSARTLGKWRNRTSKGTGTLAVLEANLTVAPTASGTGTDRWEVRATDSHGNTIVLPISTTGQTYYELDRSTGAPIIDPWFGKPNDSGFGRSGVAGFRWTFTPTQDLDLAAFSALLSFRDGANQNPATRVRGSLFRVNTDRSWTLLAKSYAWTLGHGSDWDRTGADALRFAFPVTVPVKAGVTYAITVDTFETYVVGLGMNLWAPDQFANPVESVNPGVPATVNDVNSGDAGVVPKVGATAADMAAVSWEALATLPPGTSSPTYTIDDGQVPTKIHQVGCWRIFGTISGAAPAYGDLTFSIAALGTPAAGTAGTDLNLRAVILP